MAIKVTLTHTSYDDEGVDELTQTVTVDDEPYDIADVLTAASEAFVCWFGEDENEGEAVTPPMVDVVIRISVESPNATSDAEEAKMPTPEGNSDSYGDGEPPF